MNIAAVKTALTNSKLCCFRPRVSFFHSTPVLFNRKRTRRVENRFRKTAQRRQRNYERSANLNDINDYTDYLFKNWRMNHGFANDYPSAKKSSSWCDDLDSGDDFTKGGFSNRNAWRQYRSKGGGNKSGWPFLDDEEELYYAPPDLDNDPYSWSFGNENEEDGTASSRSPPWLRKEFAKSNSRKANKKESQGWNKSYFEFCGVDDEDDETIFRSEYHGDKFYQFSFNNADKRQSRWSSRYSGQSWNWEEMYKEEFGYENAKVEPHVPSVNPSDRLALGLSPYGPLKLEDVKTAYRSCALKWHPDRHQGSSKVGAEEKFKLCSAAYQSLCDKLGMV